MDPAPPRTLLEHLVRTSRRTIEENCAAYERTADACGENATLSPRQAAPLDGRRGRRRPSRRSAGGGPALGLLVRASSSARRRATRFWRSLGPRTSGAEPLAPVGRGVPDPEPGSLLAEVERLRQEVQDVILERRAQRRPAWTSGKPTVLRHGQATRYRPPRLLLLELAADFAELQRALVRRQTASALRRLTRTTAHLAGLMFLTLTTLNEPVAARHWARTARVAADEAGDPAARAVGLGAGSLRALLRRQPGRRPWLVARQAQALAPAERRASACRSRPRSRGGRSASLDAAARRPGGPRPGRSRGSQP